LRRVDRGPLGVWKSYLAAPLVTPRLRRVTASAGVAAWKDDDSPDDLLRRADEALYAAKDTGGDSVAAHD
jgi:PleD family two-component response regulator